MSNVTVEVSGIEAKIAYLRQIKSRLKNVKPVLEVAAVDLKTLMDDAFDKSRSPQGDPWQELSNSTLEARGRKAAGPTRVRNKLNGPLPEGQSRYRNRSWTRARSEKARKAIFNAKPLIDTGRLRNSLNARTRGATSLEFGSNLIYAGSQNFGLKKKKGGPIPARPFLPVEDNGTTIIFSSRGDAGIFWLNLKRELKAYVFGYGSGGGNR